MLQQLQSLGIEPARWCRVEHDAAADGRLRAQDDPVAAGCQHRLAQPQLRVAALAHDSCGDIARPTCTVTAAGTGSSSSSATSSRQLTG